MRNLLLIVLAMLNLSAMSQVNKLNLSGEWRIALDSADVGEKEGWAGKSFDQVIMLPTTTDAAGLGVKDTLEVKLERQQLLHLTRKNSYVGAAWYTLEVEIPVQWKSKSVVLTLERVIWETMVWVDGKRVDAVCESLATPHRFELRDHLTPGKHRVTVRVDNRKKYDTSVRDLAHAYTDDTQIKWNGILGQISLEAKDAVTVDRVVVTPDIDKRSAGFNVQLSNNGAKAVSGELTLRVKSLANGKVLPAIKQKCSVATTGTSVDMRVDLGPDMLLWDEFNPNLYEVEAVFAAHGVNSVSKEVFGMRTITTRGSEILVNNNPVFMRGTLECCIFPLTGCPPMEKQGWHKVFATAREWGLNHLRFHSWCPPKAAFEMADQMGFYIQVELPVWSTTLGEDSLTTAFMYDEGERILKEYGNHPSFCFLSMGNELQRDFDMLGKLTRHLKSLDNRRLFTTSSYTFERGHGQWPETDDDFFITQRTKKGWVRGQGVFNSESPTFNKDFSASVEGMGVPLITHEIGQYAVFPNLKEIPKYTGVLKPVNFMAIQKELERKGLIDKADDYTKASGRLAAILYKEEVERALKTNGISGFQLLDLHDFPGQGTALVGLLDAFWDSKGLISAEEFRGFCSPVVPLLRYAKAVYTSDEVFDAEIEVSNYSGKKLNGQNVEWKVSCQGRELAKGSCNASELKIGYNGKVGEFSLPLSKITKAAVLDIEVALKGTDSKNSWRVWVYPQQVTPSYGDVKFTRSYDEALALLEKGCKVLYNPDWKAIEGVQGKFVPVFWSPVHFPREATAMGILCNPEHKAFADFPTQMNTDWQWWDLCNNATNMVIDNVRGGAPIVELVDNFNNNRHLALLFEGKVGNGKLVVSSIDLATDIPTRPVARQLLHSLLEYMNSSDFNPALLENPEAFGAMLKSDKK